MRAPVRLVISAALLAGCAVPPPPPPPAAYHVGTKPAPNFPPLRCAGASRRLTFAAGSATITGDAQRALAEQAAWLKQHPRSRITIAGHGDERGTQDYNFGLGYRRASAGRAILIEEGVETDRMTIVSYGDKTPFGSVVASVRCAGRRK